jgi:hypothetical protein
LYLGATLFFTILKIPLMKKLTLLAVFGMLAGFASAQQNAEASYNQHAAFAPYFYTQNGNKYRSSDGATGPN